MVSKDAQGQVPRRSSGKRGKLGVNRRLLKSRKTLKNTELVRKEAARAERQVKLGEV